MFKASSGGVYRRPKVAPAGQSPSFGNYLQSTLVPYTAVGSKTPTFTRATTAYQTDFEGKLNQVLSGEARFQGARRVRNLTTGSSEVFTGGTWLLAGAASRTAATVTFTAAAADAIYQATTMPQGTPSHTFVVKWLLSVASGTKAVRLAIGQSGVAETTAAITVTTTPTWYSMSRANTSAAGDGAENFLLRNDLAGTAGTIILGGVLFEDVTGQTNQNPSEYVSVGVLSAPYHGAGVDGVQYFTTLNGNTVASNVVTEATGAAITSAQSAAAGGVTAGVVDASGPLGYLAEGVRINLALQSQTFDTGWTPQGCNAVTADQYVAPDGTTTADKLTATAGNTQHYLQSTVSFTTTATTYTQSWYVRYTNNRWIAILFTDGTNTRGASFDILNGVAGAVTATVTSTITPTALANVYRISMTFGAAAQVGGALNYIALNNADSASALTWNAVGTETVGLWGAHLEAASFASTYIPTTTIAVQRNAEIEQYVSSGNIASTMSGTIQVTPTQTFGTFTGYIFSTYVDANNSTSVLFDGTNLIARKRISGTSHDATIAWTPTKNTMAKIGFRFDAVNGSDIWLNGTKGTTDATTTAAQIGTNFQIGADGNSLNQDFCEHRLLNVYPVSLSDAQMSAKTT